MTEDTLIVAAVTLLSIGVSACGSASDGEPQDAGKETDADAGPLPRYDSCDPDRVRPYGGIPGLAPANDGCRCDAECTDGPSGRCVHLGEAEYVCTYDECFETADCADGQRCACGFGALRQNVCVRAECSGPEDCGGLPCSVDCQYGEGAPTHAMVFACRTEGDSCRSHDDCSREDGRYCGRNPSGAWECRRGNESTHLVPGSECPQSWWAAGEVTDEPQLSCAE